MDSLTVTIDKEALRKEASLLLIGSPLWKQIQGGLILRINDPLASAASLGDLIQNVIASVEVVKANFVKSQDPDGSLGYKFDGKIALDVAVDLLDEAVVFGGVAGVIIERWDNAILKFFIEIGMGVWRGKDWLVKAKMLLALV